MNDSYLKISDVHMSFSRAGKTNPVLKAINLDIRQGEFVSLTTHTNCAASVSSTKFTHTVCCGCICVSIK